MHSNYLTSHAELLAFGSIALSRVLLATHKPFTTIVKMASPDCALSEKDIPRLDVSITDATLEDWSWTKVEDAYPHPEQGEFPMSEKALHSHQFSLGQTLWTKIEARLGNACEHVGGR